MKSTLDEMKALVAVVDTGTVRGASEVLSITPAAVSRTISRLETKLETTLLSRTTRRMSVTSEGRVYLKRVRRILEEVDLAEDQLRVQKDKPSGLLRINAATPFAIHGLTSCISHYQALYPEVEIELNTSEENIDLVGKHTDIAIRIGQLKDSSLRAVFIGSSRIRILASPEYLKEFGTPSRIDDLSSHRLLGFSKPEILKNWPLIDESDKIYKATSSLLADNGEVIRHLALSGAGIACLSDFMTYRDRKNGSLVELFKGASLRIDQPIHAIYYKNSVTSLRISSFIEFLKRHLSIENNEFI
ncbi:LysR family transcriptional regulator [Shewanella ulleungensis]|jgi:DNA-binding transcriptional LysR family regulator|uniref:LysR family transcriptional regulator n=1 Tax=Shewanella ulleungensis TaxID=2282699 RepID=A0ABQ2QTN8_9GAMM|nr:LysR family transcriptional regulator [Shewanella ulleungensis]MCL1151155.1 LysR family transcriptional regulator [Shewanella ulleungensis]GGP95967.1 LysR family transcriptional regulator [Shewanella ulleungensis]